MVDIDLLRRKLSKLNTYLERLVPLGKKTFKEYKDDPYLRFSVERLIQLIVECATDINNHVVVESGQKPPEDYRSSFVKAADAGLIKLPLARQLEGSAGMRNILVHEYMEIDDRIVFKAIPLTLKYYRRYLKAVYDFTEKIEKSK